MTLYAVSGLTNNSFLTVKAGASLAIKILRVDAAQSAATSFTVNLYTGGGAITGGSTDTPFALRDGAGTAGATSKLGASAVSGTAHTFTAQTTTTNTMVSWSPPASVVFAAGSSLVLGVFTNSTSNVTIYFDEFRLQGGF